VIDPAEWSTDAWRERATGWLEARLADAGRRRAGPVEQPRIRPWATVLTAPTDAGPVWLKACAPGTAFEVPLYGVLRRAAPERVLEPVAVDEAAGWVLLPDGGPVVDDWAGPGEPLVAELERLLPVCARFQLATSRVVPDLLACGVADMRPALMGARLDEALAATGTNGPHAGAVRRVADERDRIVGWCDELAASSIAAALDHDDLHPGNMLLAPGAPAEALRLYDWGDAVLAHPFASLLVPMRVLRHDLDCAPDDPRMLRVVDAYLDGFRGPADTLPDLRRTARLACRVARIARALVWARAVATPGVPVEERWRDAAAETLAGVLGEPWR